MKFSGKLICFVAVLSLVSGLSLFAATQFAGESMSIGVGARPLGMGGTFAGLADDASTSYWNAAGMVNIQGVEVSSVKLTKINDLDTKYSYVNLVYNTGSQLGAGAFGLGWLRQAIDGIKLTDGLGNIIADAKENADNVIYLAYAYPFIKGFSVGATVKILLGNYPALVLNGSNWTPSTVSYSGFGTDIGIFMNGAAFSPDMKWLSIGANIQDVFTNVNWDAIPGVSTGGSEKVDMNIKPGVSVKFPVQQFELVGALDLDTKYQTIVHAGGEIWWNKMVAIRGGIKSWGTIANGSAGDSLQQKPDWSLGASVRWYFIGVDYAYVYNELTPVQYLSIIGKF